MKSKCLAIILLGVCINSAFCQTAPNEKVGPIQAELIAPLSVRRLEPGKKVFAKVTLDWNGLGCALKAGATLEATVEVAERRNGRKESQLALAFNRAQCNGRDLKPMRLLLSAVAKAPTDWENMPSGVVKAPIHFASQSGDFLVQNGRVGPESTGFGTMTYEMELRGIIHKFPMSPKVQPGDVIEIPGMKLGLGVGPNRSSVLSTKSRDVALDDYTQLLLVPADLVYSPEVLGASRSASNIGDAPVPPPPAPENDLETCAPPGCAVELPLAAHELEGHKSSSISIRALGYEPRTHQVLNDFSDEEALAWLSPSQLIFTFNTHPLIHRSWTANSSATSRVIRAVLLNARDRKVIRAVSWEIADSRRYLWPISGNRILVHIGNELQVFGEDLNLEHTIPLAGPLHFVRIAPNGGLMAIATQRERHSPELHANLRDELGHEPEEDLEIAILNDRFDTVAKASTVSNLLPPTLLNEGQVNLLAQPNMHYRLALSTWDNKAVTLARFTSRCIPGLSSAAPDLMLLLSCSAVSGIHEYRVLRADGKVLLRGQSGDFEGGKEVIGTQLGGLFAIKVVHATRDISPGVDFQLMDLESEELRVIRAADGKRLLAIRIDDPTASHGNYALSSDGTQLAIQSQSQIQMIPVPSQ